MEQNERYTDKLAKYVLIAAAVCLAGAVCWYFRSVITYILVAVVVSLISKPVVKLLQKINIKGKRLPDWFLAALTLTVIVGALMSVITLLIPIVSNIVKGISLSNIESAAGQIAVPLANLNETLRNTFPSLGSSFRIETALLAELQKLLDVSKVSSLIGTATSFLSSFGVAMFSIVFIGFFFIKDDDTFTNIVTALVPDKHEKNAAAAISDIGYLLSRYFIGVLLEITGVALINFIGLWLIARLGVNAALGIAFITGLLNVIPYIGPLMGGVLGTILGLILKYSSATPLGLDVNFWAFSAILIAIFCFTQLVDNFLYQPIIYSTSIKAKPLEIFIVLLVVGHMAGPMAMIVAIPCYTVLRVIAFRFFRQYKAIRRLIPSEKLITDDTL
jgi:predicted PurR-regulated permease PerM